MTGAPVPAGTDAVVMHERHARGRRTTVQLDDPSVAARPEPAPQGPDLPRGSSAPAGRQPSLTPAALGLLASVGRTRVRVVPRPRLTILPTGDELVEPDQVPGPGQIRNSNAVMLEALALDHGRRSAGRCRSPPTSRTASATCSSRGWRPTCWS